MKKKIKRGWRFIYIFLFFFAPAKNEPRSIMEAPKLPSSKPKPILVAD